MKCIVKRIGIIRDESMYFAAAFCVKQAIWSPVSPSTRWINWHTIAVEKVLLAQNYSMTTAIISRLKSHVQLLLVVGLSSSFATPPLSFHRSFSLPRNIVLTILQTPQPHVLHWESCQAPNTIKICRCFSVVIAVCTVPNARSTHATWRLHSPLVYQLQRSI